MAACSIRSTRDVDRTVVRGGDNRVGDGWVGDEGVNGWMRGCVMRRWVGGEGEGYI